MADKLQELTQQIYKEGVAKARAEADKILGAAREENIRLSRLAREEAEAVTARAHREAEDLKARVESEVRMSARQALALTRQQLTELVTAKVAKDAAAGIFDDPVFLQKCIGMIVKAWAADKGHVQDLCIKLPNKDRKELEKHLFGEAKHHLDKGVRVEFEERIKSGFTISPADGSYRIGFTDKDFEELIKASSCQAIASFQRLIRITDRRNPDHASLCVPELFSQHFWSIDFDIHKFSPWFCVP